MRGLAALAVVLYHFTAYGGRFGRQFDSASLAVDLFFCLSGFVIAWSYHQKLVDGMTHWSYIKKRLIRLYPMFVIGLLLGLVALLVKFSDGQTSYSGKHIAEAFLLNAFYLPYFVDGSIQLFAGANQSQLFPINGVSWSLFFELVANLLFVFTIRLSKPTLVVTTVLLGVWLVASSLFHNGPAGWGIVNFIGGFPRVGYTFMLGVLIFKYLDTSSAPSMTHGWLIAIALIAMLMMPKFDGWILYYCVATILLVPLMVWQGARVKIGTPFVAKIMLYLGWISYPLYCLHGPLLSLFSSMYPTVDHYYSLMVVMLGVLWAVSHLAARYIDEPVRHWLCTGKAAPRHIIKYRLVE
jgi:peptidoglycan/LPS O-acetylase OafA/YrhL